MSQGMEYITHNDQEVLHMDYRWLGDTPDIEAAEAFYAEARKETDAQPEGSVLLLTTVPSKQRYTREGVTLMREFTRANAPYLS